MDSPIVLMCSERSGSNLICRIFDAHSEINAPSPAHLWRIYGLNSHKYGVGDDDIFARDFMGLFQNNLNPWRIDKTSSYEILSRPCHGNYGQNLSELYTAEARLHKKSCLFVKENQIYRYIALVLNSCTNPRFLLMHRDPRAVASSWMLSPVLKGGIVRATDTWLNDQIEFLRLSSILKPTFKVATIGYEELLHDPHSTLKKACKGLGINYEERMIRFHERQEATEHARSAIDWCNTGKPIMTGNSNKYLKYLSKDQIAYVEKKCGLLMQAFGYKPVGSDICHEEFVALTERLQSEEPWEKKAYQQVPERERATRKAWMAALRKIEGRSAVPCSTD